MILSRRSFLKLAGLTAVAAASAKEIGSVQPSAGTTSRSTR